MKPLRPRFAPLAFALAVTLMAGTALAWKDKPKPDAKQAVAPMSINEARASLRTRFSATPTDGEICRLPLFMHQPIPLNTNIIASENLGLSEFLVDLVGKTDAEVLRSLMEYTESAPHSRWTPALRLYLAERQYNAGYFDRAEAVWTDTWTQYRAATEGPQYELAEEALTRLLNLNSSWGRKEGIKTLLAALGKRKLSGTAYSAMDRAREALWFLERKVVQNAMCGPMALYAIKDALGQKYEPVDLDILPETTIATGISALDLQRLAAAMSINYQWAKRPPGSSEIPTPCVVHWKAGHYSALAHRLEAGYVLVDRPLRYQQTVTLEPIDAQTSGFFLVPAGPLPAGWLPATAAEVAQIFGRHCSHAAPPGEEGTGPANPTVGGKRGNCGDPPQSDANQGNVQPSGGAAMAGYTFHNLAVSLMIQDVPLRYQPPVGYPVQLVVNYKEYDNSATASRMFPNFGPQWSFNYAGSLEGYLGTPFQGATLKCFAPGGGSESFSYDSTLGRYVLTPSFSHTYIIKTGPTTFERVFPNGSRQIYARPNQPLSPTKIFLTAIQDPSGNRLTLEYATDSDRLVRIVDAIGQTNTLAYAYSDAANYYRITSVTDPFGRTASFEYDTQGRLTNLTDTIGLRSGVAYEAGDANNFITSMTTPYGTTTFRKSVQFPYKSTQPQGRNNLARILSATDPLGQTEVLMFMDNDPEDELIAPVDPKPPATNILVGGQTVSFRVGNENLHFRNTFYFSQKAWKEAQVAKDLYQMLQYAHNYHWLVKGSSYEVTSILESEKRALEGRIWYNYAGQSSDAEGMHWQGTNSRPSKVARVLDDGTTQLYQYEYNAIGKVTKSIDPVGRTFTYVYAANDIDLIEARQTRTGNDLLTRIQYDARHLPTNITDTAGESMRMTYNSQGQLLTRTDPLGNTWTNTYDAKGYLLSIDGPRPGASNTVKFTYNPRGLPATVRDVDGTVLTFQYDNFDRVTNIAYPDGTTKTYTFDRFDLAAVKDRENRVTSYRYDSLRRRIETVDPLLRTNRYAWCSCGSMKSLTDELGQMTKWHHDAQSRLVAKEYADGSQVKYLYGPYSGRLVQRVDEKGQVKQMDYNVDDTLSRVSYPLARVPTPPVSYTYDTNYNRLLRFHDLIGTTTCTYHPTTPGNPGAGRLAAVDGPWDNDTIAYAYDQLGRIIQRSVGGVSESVIFDVIGRPTTISNQLGSFAIVYDGVTTRPLSVSHSGGQKTEYTYLPATQNFRLQRIRHLRPDGVTPLSVFDYAYDASGRILSWRQQEGPAAVQARKWAFGYDQAGQVTSAVATQDAVVVESRGWGYDLAGNRLTQTVDGTTATSSYNALNELVSTTATLPTLNYEWDAENRLLAINYAAGRTEFTYDGLGRRVRVVEKQNGSVVSSLSYLWDGLSIREQRDASGAKPQQRYFAGGYADLFGSSPQAYLHTTDHLGSIRETTDTAGNIRERVSYDLWGNPTFSTGAVTAPFAFTGHVFHKRSGLHLAPFRAYSAPMGRWVSRDPMHESDGVNMFVYCHSDPGNQIDKFGDFQIPVFGEVIAGIKGVGPVDAATGFLDGLISMIIGGVGECTPGDAMRHCLWSCSMTKNLGKEQAAALLENHERCNPNRPDAFEQDQLNNQIGQSYGLLPTGCYWSCRKARLDGTLHTTCKPRR
jgi:RHS repeat-associated protein